MQRTTLAGIGGITFALFTFAAAALAMAPGGTYKISNATSFVSSGHRPAVFIALYLAVAGALGLICLLIGLGDALAATGDARHSVGRIFYGVGLAAAIASAVGWCIALSVPVAYAVSSGGDSFSLPPAQIYAMDQAGNAVVFGASGLLLGASLLILAIAGGSFFPGWLRAVTAIAGVLGLASIAFFPWFALLIWALVTGIWMLTAGRSALTVAAPPEPSAG